MSERAEDMEGLAATIAEDGERWRDMTPKELAEEAVGAFQHCDEDPCVCVHHIEAMFTALRKRATLLQGKIHILRRDKEGQLHAKEDAILALREDRDRLDWLEAATRDLGSVFGDGMAIVCYTDSRDGKDYADIGHLDGEEIHWGDASGGTLRAAIDALRTPNPDALSCCVVEYDGAFKCTTHGRVWGAATNPDEPCGSQP